MATYKKYLEYKKAAEERYRAELKTIEAQYQQCTGPLREKFDAACEELREKFEADCRPFRTDADVLVTATDSIYQKALEQLERLKPQFVYIIVYRTVKTVADPQDDYEVFATDELYITDLNVYNELKLKDVGTRKYYRHYMMYFTEFPVDRYNYLDSSSFLEVKRKHNTNNSGSYRV